MENGPGHTHTKQDRVVREGRVESRVPFKVVSDLRLEQLELLCFWSKQDPSVLTPTSPTQPPWCCTGGR